MGALQALQGLVKEDTQPHGFSVTCPYRHALFIETGRTWSDWHAAPAQWDRGLFTSCTQAPCSVPTAANIRHVMVARLCFINQPLSLPAAQTEATPRELQELQS